MAWLWLAAAFPAGYAKILRILRLCINARKSANSNNNSTNAAANSNDICNFGGSLDAERRQEPFLANRRQHSRQSTSENLHQQRHLVLWLWLWLSSLRFPLPFYALFIVAAAAAATSPSLLLRTTMWQVAHRPTSRFVFLCFCVFGAAAHDAWVIYVYGALQVLASKLCIRHVVWHLNVHLIAKRCVIDCFALLQALRRINGST